MLGLCLGECAARGVAIGGIGGIVLVSLMSAAFTFGIQTGH
jgi:hypothetical protein